MAIVTLKQLWKNEYFQTAVMIILTVAIVFGFWYSLQLVLNTQYPALAVASGSMCMLPGSDCDGWSHPFERTLHVGDLILVQGVDAKGIKAEPYPDGDIIVFHRPSLTDDRIVHRAIRKETYNGKIYFRTQGDGNGSPDYHYGEGTWNGMVSQDLVIGKVILRIPWIGHLSLFMQESSGTIIIITLIIVIIIVEFVIPAFTSKEAQTEQKKDSEKDFET